MAAGHLGVGVEIGGQWVAVAVFSLATDEAELLLLAVEPDFQRRGIATQLLKQMEGPLSKVANELFLEVRRSNLSAISVYESLGFNCLGERLRYYPIPGAAGKREDALIFGKHISANTYVEKQPKTKPGGGV